YPVSWILEASLNRGYTLVVKDKRGTLYEDGYYNALEANHPKGDEVLPSAPIEDSRDFRRIQELLGPLNAGDSNKKSESCSTLPNPQEGVWGLGRAAH